MCVMFNNNKILNVSDNTIIYYFILLKVVRLLKWFNCVQHHYIQKEDTLLKSVKL